MEHFVALLAWDTCIINKFLIGDQFIMFIGREIFGWGRALFCEICCNFVFAAVIEIHVGGEAIKIEMLQT